MRRAYSTQYVEYEIKLLFHRVRRDVTPPPQDAAAVVAATQHPRAQTIFFTVPALAARLSLPVDSVRRTIDRLRELRLAPIVDTGCRAERGHNDTGRPPEMLAWLKGVEPMASAYTQAVAATAKAAPAPAKGEVAA